MIISDLTPMWAARQWTKDQAESGGGECPCCGQRSQVYKRSINSGMARSLVIMYGKAGKNWINVPSAVGGKSREEGKLRYWGLVTESNNHRADGGHAGWWRVTDKGENFILDGLNVPKYALIYDGTLVRLDGDPVDIKYCIRNRFDLSQLLADSKDAR